MAAANFARTKGIPCLMIGYGMQLGVVEAVRSLLSLPDANSVFYFVGIDNARFKKPVTAGDQLHLHVEITRQMRGIWKYKAEAKVDGEVVAEAELMCAKRDVA